MSDEYRVVTCPDCSTEQRLNEFFIEVGKAFGLKGMCCEDCGETIPAEIIKEQKVIQNE